jgi:hypothetical protein
MQCHVALSHGAAHDLGYGNTADILRLLDHDIQMIPSDSPGLPRLLPEQRIVHTDQLGSTAKIITPPEPISPFGSHL